MENTNFKRVIVFSKDDAMMATLVDTLVLGLVCQYPYTTDFSDINFSNSVVLLDYDVEDFEVEDMLPLLVRAAGVDTKVILISKNCERRNVANCAKNGAARFIVKPLNKKRIKRFILPYLTMVTQDPTSASA
jgi:response regulator of citrate/malate metabolism